MVLFSAFAGFISKFGAGLFLLIQVIILLDATHSWNDSWVAKDEQKWLVQFLILFNNFILGPFLIFKSLTFFVQVYCFACDLCGMLYCNICFFWNLIYVVQSFWTWLWTERVLHCNDHDPCICICCYCFAPKGKCSLCWCCFFHLNTSSLEDNFLKILKCFICIMHYEVDCLLQMTCIYLYAYVYVKHFL